MDSDEETEQIKQFYKNWLTLNQPRENQLMEEPADIEPQPMEEEPANIEPAPDIQNIIYQNDLFELYVEKGKFFSQ